MTSTEWLCMVAVCLASGVARAQTPAEEVVRRRLILQAGALRDQGDHQGALDRLREAAVRRVSPSLRLFIAQEELALGQRVEALRDARLCAVGFESAENLAHRDEFMAACRAMVDELSQQNGRLIVRLPSDAPEGVTVTVRGRPLPRSAWGNPWDLAPGTARVEATAPGRARFVRELTIPAGTSASVSVEFSAATSAPEASREPSPEASEAPLRVEPRPDAPSGRGGDAGRWALLGVGGGLLVGAAVFYGLQNSAISDRDALCQRPTGRCSVVSDAAAQEVRDLQDRAANYNILTNLSLGLGAAAALGGLVWWVIDLSAGSSGRRRAAVRVAPTGDGAALRGVF